MTPGATIAAQLEDGVGRLYWLALALFVAYLGIGMALPAVPLFVTVDLRRGNALAGLAVGIAFAATILTRGMAGHLADGRGSRLCLIRGLWLYIAAGLVCAAAALRGLPVPAAFMVLTVGRLLLGVGESLATVGLLAWCFGVAGPARSGQVFSVVGMAVYGAFAVGGPLGVALFERFGFTGAMAACTMAPFAALLMALPVAEVPVHAGERLPFRRIIGRIWEPGIALALQGVGSAAIGAFAALMFVHRGWPYAGFGLTCFGVAFVTVRVVAGHLPDRFSSIPVAFGSTAVEAVGQLLLWLAPNPVLALAGTVLTGVGCSLMFPAMGIEVVRRVPPHLRATAAGGLAMFQGPGAGGDRPMTGLLADRLGYGMVFLAGGLAAGVSLLLVVRLWAEDRRQGARAAQAKL